MRVEVQIVNTYPPGQWSADTPETGYCLTCLRCNRQVKAPLAVEGLNHNKRRAATIANALAGMQDDCPKKLSNGEREFNKYVQRAIPAGVDCFLELRGQRLPLTAAGRELYAVSGYVPHGNDVVVAPRDAESLPIAREFCRELIAAGYLNARVGSPARARRS